MTKASERTVEQCCICGASGALIARVRELELSLRQCVNLTHRQEQSPDTVRAVGQRVAEIARGVGVK